MSSSNTSSSSPAPGASSSLTGEQKLALNALVIAASTIHSGRAILDIAENVYGKSIVDNAVTECRQEERAHGMNGWHGEGPGHKALAHAYVLLIEGGEDAAAEAVEKVALDRMVTDDWEIHVQSVHRGW